MTGPAATTTDSARPLVVVTGAARRVGRAIALELAGVGCDLVLTYRNSADDMARTADEACRAAEDADRTIDCRTIEADFDAAPHDWSAVAEAVADRPLAGLVHNASSYASSPFGAITADEAMRHYRVNALAPLLGTQQLADRLRGSTLPGGGAVICFSDIHALGRPRRNFASYAMSKAAANQVIHSLARDLAPDVRVNGIAPGVIAWPDDTAAEERQAYERRTPLQRSGSPDDAARLVRWLIFSAPFITGEIIRVDGGRWLV